MTFPLAAVRTAANAMATRPRTVMPRDTMYRPEIDSMSPETLPDTQPTRPEYAETPLAAARLFAKPVVDVTPRSAFDSSLDAYKPDVYGEGMERTAERADAVTIESDPPDESLFQRMPVKIIPRTLSQDTMNMVNAGEPEPVMPDHSQDAPRGFGAKIKHFFEHLGKGAIAGAAASGGNPFGMIAGAVGGGVNPEFADRLMHNNVTVPMWRQRNEYAGRLADQRLNRAKDVANLTGVDPLTGQPTMEAQREARIKEAMELENQSRLENTRSLTEQRQSLAEQRRETNARNAVESARKMRMPVPEAAVRGTTFAPFAGVVPPTDMGELDRIVDTFGAYRQPLPGNLVKGTPYESLGGQTIPEKPTARESLSPYQIYQMNKDVLEQQDKARKEDKEDERRLYNEYKEAEEKARAFDANIRTRRAELAKLEGEAGADKDTDPVIISIRAEIAQAEADSRNRWQGLNTYADELEDRFGYQKSGGPYPSVKPPARAKNRSSSGVTMDQARTEAAKVVQQKKAEIDANTKLSAQEKQQKKSAIDQAFIKAFGK